MRQSDVREFLNECSDVYEERASNYAPDPNFAEEGMALTSGFLEDMYRYRADGAVMGRYVLPAYVPDEVAVWTKVGDKIARLRTRGVPGTAENNEDFVDDAKDLIVFLAMAIILLRQNEVRGSIVPVKDDEELRDLILRSGIKQMEGK